MSQRIRNWLRTKPKHANKRQPQLGDDRDTPAFPPELWFEIISTYLPPKDIQALSLCSKFFRNISIPTLFKTFTIHPPSVRDIPSWPPHTFLIPNHIAPIIKTIAILPNGTTLQTLSQNLPRRWNDGTQIDEILESLLTLPKLQHLICDHVPFTQSLLTKLVQLPLKQLVLSDCVMPSSSITPIKVIPPGTLETIKLYFPKYNSFGEQGQTSLANVLLRHSPNLTSIYLEDTITFPMMRRVCPASLTSLNIPANYIDKFPVDFVNILTTCTSLKSISLRCVHYTGTSVFRIPILLPSKALPNLERYGGPFDISPSFTNNRPSIKEIYLICPSESTLSAPPNSTSLNPVTSIPTSIESVTCSFRSLTGTPTTTTTTFASVHSSLNSESLKRLTIILSSSEWTLEGLPRLFESSSSSSGPSSSSNSNSNSNSSPSPRSSSSKLIPLPNIRHFTLRAAYDITQPKKSSNLSRLKKILEASLSGLLMVYPNLEEAMIIPVPSRSFELIPCASRSFEQRDTNWDPLAEESEFAMVWRRSTGPGLSRWVRKVDLDGGVIDAWWKD
ncbi:hypothetical protein BDN72DRAFT_878718 [Pluteus cervinus]|uniref:Uncharacterized protein n=1 Tax=Pluteus cervinus TaxID=181527 RepID=A0ACD3AU22_9AGAR|nr:hypothetical protein BDN72DRAFT_878718 [Pluteus cervinus]